MRGQISKKKVKITPSATTVNISKYLPSTLFFKVPCRVAWGCDRDFWKYTEFESCPTHSLAGDLEKASLSASTFLSQNDSVMTVIPQIYDRFSSRPPLSSRSRAFSWLPRNYESFVDTRLQSMTSATALCFNKLIKKYC